MLNTAIYSSVVPDEVIGYCESRLRAAFNVLEHADQHKAEWIYDNMMRELVSIMPSIQNKFTHESLSSNIPSHGSVFVQQVAALWMSQ
jgi:hypothetical protein